MVEKVVQLPEGFVEVGFVGEVKQFIEKGDSICGKLIKKGNFFNKTTGKNSNFYRIQGMNDGKVYVIFGTSQLDLKMNEVREGEEVVIIYEGKRSHPKMTGRTLHFYKVYHRPVNS